MSAVAPEPDCGKCDEEADRLAQLEELKVHPLHRKRALAAGVVRHWAHLVMVSLAGAAWMSAICYWTVRASVRMCDYVVNDKESYNPDSSIMEAVIELQQCRFSLKNFAWNDHWTMLVSYGFLKELYDLMVPLIFGLNLFGAKLDWRAGRRRFFTYGIPLLVASFILVWHAGLGQPGLLRSTILGQVVFYTLTAACFVEMGGLMKKMAPTARLDVNWLFFIFGFAVVFPTYVYRFFIMPLSFGRGKGDYNKVVMRMVAHPIICEAALCILRNFARQLNDTRHGMPSMLLVVVLVIRSVFGRFLIMQVGNVGSVILLQACISFINLISRITVKDIDSTFLLLMYGSRASEAVLSSRKHNDLLVFEQQISMLCEYTAIIAVPIFVVAGRISLGGVAPDVALLVKNAVGQVGLQVVIDLVSILYDVFYHCVDHLHVWKTRRDSAYLRFLFLHFTVHGFFVFYNSIFSMFCPLWSSETSLGGLRMDYCVVQGIDSMAELTPYWLLKTFPNYAPNAAPPLLGHKSWNIYEARTNPAVCRGTNGLENCMIDSWPIAVQVK